MLKRTCMHWNVTICANLSMVVYVYIYMLVEQISKPGRSPRLLHRLILVFLSIPISVLIAIKILRDPISLPTLQISSSL